MRETMLKTGVVDLQGFFNLIRHNDMKEMEKKLGEANIKVVGGANCWDDYGTYPVHMAAAEGHTDMLCLLIEYGAEVDQQTTLEHRTALHFAVINKSHAAVRYLIDVGARTDIKDIYQKTARMYAVDEDAMRVVFEVSALAAAAALLVVLTVLHLVFSPFRRARLSTSISRTFTRFSTA